MGKLKTAISLLAVFAVVSCRDAVPVQRERHNAPHIAATKPAPETPERIYVTPEQTRDFRPNEGWPRIVTSLLKVSGAMSYGESYWHDVTGHRQEAILIRVDLERQIMSVFRGGDEIGTAVILYGVDDYPTPRGSFPVMAMIRDHVSATYDAAPMPFTLRLTADGVSIHGSNVRSGMGTHGCVGIPADFAQKLFSVTRPGHLVKII